MVEAFVVLSCLPDLITSILENLNSLNSKCLPRKKKLTAGFTDSCQTEHPCVGLMVCLLTIVKVRDWYLDSFRDIRYFPEVRNRDDELAFTQMIKMIKVRHNNVVPTMALGVQQLKNEQFSSRKLPPGFDEIHEFLDRFYMSRIGIRMLIGL